MIKFDEVVFPSLIILVMICFIVLSYIIIYRKDNADYKCMPNNGVLISKYAGGFVCLKKDSLIEMKDNK